MTLPKKEAYANGQKVYEISGDQLSFYYKNATLKAKGPYVNGLMEGEWHFFRETGQLWQVGHFHNEKKNGSWVRYDKNGIIEYFQEFINDKILKK